jgi:transcriptional regulator with XRE-family HTH domain
MILKVSIAMTRKSILKVSIRQIKAARALLDWSQEQLAASAEVSIPTIKRLEANDGPLGGRGLTVEKILTSLEAAGVEFTNGDQPGVRLTRAAAARSAEAAAASKPSAAPKVVRGQTANTPEKKR